MALPGVLPYPLGITSGGTGLYTPTDVTYNYAIGALPFLSAATRDHPYQRTTAQFRKQQFDNSDEPGEQSIEGWWLRSQQSFHAGAGMLYADPGSGDPNFHVSRFYDSAGIDVWTQGRLRLLPRTSLVSGQTLIQLVGLGTGGAYGLSGAANPLFFISSTDTVVLEASPTGSSPLSVCADEQYFYVAADDGIWRRLRTAAAHSAWTKIWNLAGSTGPRIAFVKQRLVMASMDGVFELSGAGPGLPAAKWVPPSGLGYWSASAIVEGGSAIYVCTYTGSVLKFSLDSSGVMPTLTSGSVVAQLPSNERIWSALSILNRYIVLGTDEGARVCLINSDGSLEVGPLLWTGLRVQALTTSKQYVYCSVFDTAVTTGDADIYRIDLGLEITNLRFAYARDLRVDGGETGYGITGFGSVQGLALYNSGKLLIGGAMGVYAEQDTYVDSGYLQTSRIRFNTLEPKVYKLVRVRGVQTPADFFVSILDTFGSEVDVIGYVTDQVPGEEDADIPRLGPQDYVSLKFTLSSDATNVLSAECQGYQLKALPATPRRRMIQIPLLCFDMETDRNGNGAGYVGSAVSRLQALEDLDAEADVVNVQDLDRSVVERCVIESVEFVQTAPPTGMDGWGGLITLTVRTV